MFHQIEGLYVAEAVTFTDQQYDLQSFLSRFFEREAEVRFRPSYFPFDRRRRRKSTSWYGTRGPLAGDARLRHGLPQGVRGGGHRSRALHRLRLRHGHRTRESDAALVAVDDLRLFFNNDHPLPGAAFLMQALRKTGCASGPIRAGDDLQEIYLIASVMGGLSLGKPNPLRRQRRCRRALSPAASCKAERLPAGGSPAGVSASTPAPGAPP